MKTLITLLACIGLLAAAPTASARDFHHHGVVVHRGGYGYGYRHGGVGFYPGIGIGVSPYYGYPAYGSYYDPYYDGGYYGGVGVYAAPGYYYSGGHRYYRGGGSSRGHSFHGSSHHHH